MLLITLSIAILSSIANGLTTNSFVETVTGVTSFVPADASINSENRLVYSTVVDGTATLVSTDAKGWLTTSIEGGHETTTTASSNIAVESFTHTTTHLDTQIVGNGEFYTTTTYDNEGKPTTFYVKQDPRIVYTSTTYDHDGKPHTYYESLTTSDGSIVAATIDASSVSELTASTPTTDSSLASFTIGTSNTYSTGLATANNAAVAVGSCAGAALGAIAAFLI